MRSEAPHSPISREVLHEKCVEKEHKLNHANARRCTTKNLFIPHDYQEPKVGLVSCRDAIDSLSASLYLHRPSSLGADKLFSDRSFFINTRDALHEG